MCNSVANIDIRSYLNFARRHQWEKESEEHYGTPP